MESEIQMDREIMSNIKIDREMKNLRYRNTERCITPDIVGQRDEESEIMLEIEKKSLRYR
jgi:hypothetical protein